MTKSRYHLETIDEKLDYLNHLIHRRQSLSVFCFPALEENKQFNWNQLFQETYVEDYTIYSIGEELYFGNIELDEEELRTYNYNSNKEWKEEMEKDYGTLLFQIERKVVNLNPQKGEYEFNHSHYPVDFLHLKPVFNTILFDN